MLSENATVVLKFMLHISFEQQGRRLQERIDGPTKHWKFSMGDRKHASSGSCTSTPWAPWTMVPADSKTHRNLMIATLVRQALQTLDLRYPPADPALNGLKIT